MPGSTADEEYLVSTPSAAAVALIQLSTGRITDFIHALKDDHENEGILASFKSKLLGNTKRVTLEEKKEFLSQYGGFEYEEIEELLSRMDKLWGFIFYYVRDFRSLIVTMREEISNKNILLQGHESAKLAQRCCKCLPIFLRLASEARITSTTEKKRELMSHRSFNRVLNQILQFIDVERTWYEGLGKYSKDEIERVFAAPRKTVVGMMRDLNMNIGSIEFKPLELSTKEMRRQMKELPYVPDEPEWILLFENTHTEQLERNNKTAKLKEGSGGLLTNDEIIHWNNMNEDFDATAEDTLSLFTVHGTHDRDDASKKHKDFKDQYCDRFADNRLDDIFFFPWEWTADYEPTDSEKDLEAKLEKQREMLSEFEPEDPRAPLPTHLLPKPSEIREHWNTDSNYEPTEFEKKLKVKLRKDRKALAKFKPIEIAELRKNPIKAKELEQEEQTSKK